MFISCEVCSILPLAMSLRMHIATFRLLALIPLLLSQTYLFFRGRRALLSSLRQGRSRRRVIIATGLAMAVLFVMNADPVFRRTVWVEPSWGARIFFFYLPAIWAFVALSPPCFSVSPALRADWRRRLHGAAMETSVGTLPPARTLSADGFLGQGRPFLPRRPL